MALDGDRLLARLVWWTTPGGDVLLQFDFFDVDDTLPRADRDEIGLRLFRTATATVFPAGAKLPEFGRFVPPDWHEDPAAREVSARESASYRAANRTPYESHRRSSEALSGHLIRTWSVRLGG
ncbi:hypothetical protein [Streptomyces sp. NPDC056169]|uniref:hypothetical protein n=1 Tax=Streptomyces sp. NPDC056169 TaxID=3345734 RepID=UPI0035E17E7E